MLLAVSAHAFARAAAPQNLAARPSLLIGPAFGPRGSPTPPRRSPFQRATSWPWLSKLCTSLPLAEQPLGKIYSLRQFRHLPAQLLPAFDQLGVVFGGSGVRRSVPQPFGVGLPDGRERDHPREKASHRDDRNEQRENVFHHPSRGLASSRSAKSIRSARSATSCRTAWSSLRISSRSAGSIPGLRCSPAMRLEIAETTGRSTNTNPPTTAMSAKTSPGFIARSSWRAAARTSGNSSIVDPTRSR